MKRIDSPDILRKVVRPKFGKKPDLKNFAKVCEFLHNNGFQVVIKKLSTGITSCTFRLPDNKIVIFINDDLDDDEKLMFSLHEFIESHFDRSNISLQIMSTMDVLLKRVGELKKPEKKAIVNPFPKEVEVIDAFFNCLRSYIFEEFLVWQFCSKLMDDAELSRNRRHKLFQIVKRRIYNLTCFSSVLTRYDFYIWKVLRGDYLPPFWFKNEVRLELIREIAAFMSRYVKIRGTCDEKEVARYQRRFIEIIHALETLKALVKQRLKNA